MISMTTMSWIQIVLSIVLITTILIQRGSSGAGSAFGGGDSNAQIYQKRGLEKALFYFTIVIAILFALSALVRILM